MHKTLVASVALCSFLFASSPIEVEKSGKYLIGEAHYNAKNYDASFKIFSELFKSHTDNKMVNYYLGLNYMQKKEYDQAVGAFERVLITDPAFYRARLEYAVALAKTNQKEQAKEEIKTVLTSPLPEVVRKNVETFLATLERENDMFIKNGIFMFGMSRDSNHNNGLDDPNFTIPAFGVTVTGSEAKGLQHTIQCYF